MSWLRALKETARSGLEIERLRLEPLIAVRGAAGLALVVGVSLALFGPVIAAGSAFGAFQAAIATFQRSWRPRPVLALVSGASLAVSTFVGYVTVSHTLLFLALLILWTFAAGMTWAAGPTGGIIAGSNVSIMLVTITLPTSVLDAAAHAGMMAFGGFVQAALIVLFPVRRWGAQRDALADALAGMADYARRLRNDPVAPFDPVPLMTARNAAAVTPRQARRRPADLHGARGVAERLRPVLASLADPALGVPAEGPERYWVWEILGAAGSLLDSAARAVRHGDPVQLDETALSVLKSPDTEVILVGPPGWPRSSPTSSRSPRAPVRMTGHRGSRSSRTAAGPLSCGSSPSSTAPCAGRCAGGRRSCATPSVCRRWPRRAISWGRCCRSATATGRR